jgi:hypothetical protein
MSYWLEDDYGDWIMDLSGHGRVEGYRRAGRLGLKTFRKFLDTGKARAEELPQIIKECEAGDDWTRKFAQYLKKMPADSGMRITDGTGPDDDPELPESP